MLVVIVSLFYLCFGADVAVGWGTKTHKAIATIAEGFLSKTTRKFVEEILVGDEIHVVAAWADGYCHKVHWCSTMHYIDTSEGECAYDPSQDCPRGVCVPTALANYTKRLIERTGADIVIDGMTGSKMDLGFATHFVMDMNQPLHCGQKQDRGGNSIHGRFLTRKTNLHQVWDDGLPEAKMKELGDKNGNGKFIEYMHDAVEEDIRLGTADTWTRDLSAEEAAYKRVYNQWTSEGAYVACQYAYRDESGNLISDGFDLQEPYNQFAGPVAEVQVRKSVVRLATMLNVIYDDSFKGMKQMYESRNY